MSVDDCHCSRSVIAYNGVDEVSAAIGISRSVIYEHIALGNLTPRYPSSKPVFLRSEVEAFIRSLPTEPPRRRS